MCALARERKSVCASLCGDMSEGVSAGVCVSEAKECLLSEGSEDEEGERMGAGAGAGTGGGGGGGATAGADGKEVVDINEEDDEGYTEHE